MSEHATWLTIMPAPFGYVVTLAECSCGASELSVSGYGHQDKHDARKWAAAHVLSTDSRKA